MDEERRIKILYCPSCGRDAAVCDETSLFGIRKASLDGRVRFVADVLTVRCGCGYEWKAAKVRKKTPPCSGGPGEV